MSMKRTSSSQRQGSNAKSSGGALVTSMMRPLCTMVARAAAPSMHTAATQALSVAGA